MKVSINSMSPTGINFVSTLENAKNTERNQLKDFCRSQELDGVIDQNRLIATADILVTHILISAKKAIRFEIVGTRPCVEMCFYLSTSASYEPADSNTLITINTGHHNLFHFPTLPYQNFWPLGEGQELVSIIISTDLFMRYVPDDSAFFDFKERIVSGQTNTLFQRSAPITLQIHHLLTEILKMEAYPELRHMYLESRVIELLSEQFRQYMELKNGTQSLYRTIPSEERDRIYQLKLYIDKHITILFSLRELADQAGISEYYLKKYFKLCYGVSLHQYIHAERMKLAKILLLREGMNINEVSTFLNITETTNFVAAFKKHFGLPPGKFQKQGLLPH